MKIPLLKNTLTNYLNLFVRFVQGILITRWLIANLGEEAYGFWGLLWSFFCYSLLLDFGLGVAAQKATAVELYRRDIHKYNRLISMVFTINMLMSLLIVAGTLAASVFIRQLLHLEGSAAADPSYYRQCLICCGIGSAVVFTFGVFTEILTGLQKIYLRNYVTSISKIMELVIVIAVFACGGGLLSLLIATLGLMALTQLINALFVYQTIPGFKLRLRFDKEMFLETFHFSGAVYILSLAKLVWDRGAALLISIFSGLSLVSTYLVGARFPQLITQLTYPYQENITPLSALLHSRKKQRKLAEILLNSMRWHSLLTTGMVIGVFIYARVIIRFMLGVDSQSAAYICQIMSLLILIQLVFRAIPEKYLLMTEQHGFVSKIFAAESMTFVTVSILLLALTGLNGAYAVVYSALLARIFFTGVFVMPRFLRQTNLHFFEVLRETVCRLLFAALPVILIAQTEYYLFAGKINDFILIVIAGISCIPVYLLLAFIFCINRRERRKLPVIAKFIKSNQNKSNKRRLI